MPKGNDILTFLAYALPVAGGLAGMIFVNLNREDFVNPVTAVALGAVMGWGLARLLRALAGRR